jgi:hypothetical protein
MCGSYLSTEDSIILVVILVSIVCGGGFLIYWVLTGLKNACIWKTHATNTTTVGNTTVAFTTTADADVNHFDTQVENEDVTKHVACKHSTELDLHRCTDMEASLAKEAAISPLPYHSLEALTITTDLVVPKEHGQSLPVATDDEETLQPKDNMPYELDFWPKVAVRCIIVTFLFISIGVLDRLFDGDHAHIFFAFGVLTLMIFVCIRCIHATEISAAVKAARRKIIRIGIIMGISSLSLCVILVFIEETPVLMMALLVYGILCLFLTSYHVCMVQQEANWTVSFIDVINGVWVS